MHKPQNAERQLRRVRPPLHQRYMLELRVRMRCRSAGVPGQRWEGHHLHHPRDRWGELRPVRQRLPEQLELPGRRVRERRLPCRLDDVRWHLHQHRLRQSQLRRLRSRVPVRTGL